VRARVRFRHLAAVAASAALAGGCGGSEPSAGAVEGTEIPAPAWAKPVIAKAGPDVAMTMASSDFARGENRLAFLLVRNDGSLVQAPRAHVYYRLGGKTRKATATLTPLGVDGDDAESVYVTRIAFETAGKHWVVVEPEGGELQAFQIIDVKEKTTAPAVGERAVPIVNPTTERKAAREISTQRPPDTALLRHTVAESLERGVPFVLVFATPEYCHTRACGPAVDVVSAVRRRYEGRGIRFIHVEIYEDNTPGKGVNEWVRQWNLPSEPWVFVVDADGIVRARFEGAIGADEVDAAIAEHLLR